MKLTVLAFRNVVVVALFAAFTISGLVVAEPRIVEGNEISLSDSRNLYPFLTRVRARAPYTVTVDGLLDQYFAFGIAKEPEAPLQGSLVFCDNWESGSCPGVQNAICVIDAISIGGLNFSRATTVRALNSCAASGAIAGLFAGQRQSITAASFSFRDNAALIPGIFMAISNDSDLNTLASFVNLNQSVTITPSEFSLTARCGASYLGDNWVLTAAHCVRDGSDFGAAVSVYNVAEASPQAFIPSVTELYPNLPAYEASIAGFGPTDNSDYALIRLQSPPVGGVPVKIATPETLQFLLNTRAPVMVLGWGDTVFEGFNQQDTPRIATQFLVPTEECISAWANRDEGRATIDANVHVCALGAPNPGREFIQDSCQGDSGGPLIATIDGEIQLVGITSFGAGCGDTNEPPPVYANATSIISWIEAVTGLTVGATRVPVEETTAPEVTTPVVEDTPATDNSHAICVDSDGDGWGWNGTESCLIDSPNLMPEQDTTAPDDISMCIDTDGDGWGWNGVASCRIEQAPAAPEEDVTESSGQVAVCIDSDGDGWGWNGVESCRIESVQVEPVVPTGNVQSLLTNGGFDTGTNAWHVCDASTGTVTEHQGDAVRLSDKGCLYQNISVEPGATYTLTCRASSTAKSYSSISIQMLNNRFTQLSEAASVVTSDSYQTYSTHLIAPGNATYASINLYSGGTAFVDECSVVRN